MGVVNIKWGDNLTKLASQFGTSVNAIVQANKGKISDPNKIFAGDSLKIPGSRDEFVDGPSSSTGSRRGGGTDGTDGSSSSGSTGPMPAGQVGDWIKQATDILRSQGVDASKMNARDIAAIIQHESGGNPNAQNNWDSNARAGTPSIGLMQTIGPTFNSYKLPGHDNIRNPIDNIIAGVRYAISRYGSVSNVPGIVGMRSGSGYVGY